MTTHIPTYDSAGTSAGHSAELASPPWPRPPEPYDFEAYTAWARTLYGDKWYSLRERMLKERVSFVVETDRKYRNRQGRLRQMEAAVEGCHRRAGLTTKTKDGYENELWDRELIALKDELNAEKEALDDWTGPQTLALHRRRTAFDRRLEMYIKLKGGEPRDAVLARWQSLEDKLVRQHERKDPHEDGTRPTDMRKDQPR